MRGRIVVQREAPVEAPTVAEYPKCVPSPPVGGRQHEQKNAEVFGYVARSECRGLLKDEGALSRCQIKLLPVRVVAVLEGL